MYLLTADIGGTHSRFALFDRQPDSCKQIVASNYNNHNYKNLEQVLQVFLDQHNLPVEQACLALAAPVVDNSKPLTLTNIAWTIDADKLKSRFKLHNCFLINDFAAIAHGIDHLNKDDFYQIQSGQPITPDHPFIIAGPGTGLGVSLLIRQKHKSIQVLSTESGHCSFAPESTLQIELLNYLLKNNNSTVWEKVLSGSGLQLLYRFISGQPDAPEPQQISDTGLNNPNSTEHQVVLEFIHILALFSRNIALATLPACLFFCGSILQQLLPGLGTKGIHHFTEIFCQHETHADILKTLPVQLISKTDIALYGAMDYMINQLK